MFNRVVVTGYHVILPNINNKSNLKTFLESNNVSYGFNSLMEENKFLCHVGGQISGVDEMLKEVTQEFDMHQAGENTKLSMIAGIKAYLDAGFLVSENTDYELGVMIGSGFNALDYFAEKVVPKVLEKKVKKIGSFAVQNIMNSNATAHLASYVNAGGMTFGVSNACCSGTDTIIEAYHAIKNGRIEKVLTGGVEEGSLYTWSCFDSMYVLNRKFNLEPEKASAPMSTLAAGFVPSAGAACLMIESLDSAKNRGAHIYAEILSGYNNCGAQNNGGSMNFPNSESVQYCIEKTIADAKINANEIDLINGHLTGTKADSLEVANWKSVFDNQGCELPFIQASKSKIGHTLGAAGAVETCFVINQMENEFIHGNVNCEELNPEIANIVNSKKILKQRIDFPLKTVIKSSFGFGDVNSCIILKKFEDE